MTSPKRPTSPKSSEPNYSTITTTGIEPNVAAALSYILGLITGIVFLILEKQNKYVRFHAAQSTAISVMIILLSIGVSLVSGVLAFIPVVGWIVVLLLTTGLTILTFVLWLALMFKAFQGEEWELPVAGGIARQLAGR